MHILKYKPQYLKLQKRNLQHHCGVKGFLYPKLFSHYWCWELEAGNPTLATHKESSDGGQGDEDEDAMRIGVKTKILYYIAGSVVTLVMRNVLLHSFFPSSNNYELTPWWTELSARDTGKTWSHGAESQLGEAELRHVDHGGKEIGRSVVERILRRRNCLRSSHSPALQESSSDFTFSGDHSFHVLCKKKGTCWVPSL